MPSWPGRSLVPALSEDIEVPRPYLWWMHDDHKAILKGSWKLVTTKGGTWELYDLSKDRSETRDLITQYPEKAAELEKIWKEHLDATIEIVAKTPENAAPPRKQKR